MRRVGSTSLACNDYSRSMKAANEDDATAYLAADVKALAGACRYTLDAVDLSRVKRQQLPWMIQALRVTETHARELRRALEGTLARDRRTCPVCDTAVTGRSDRVYCSARCRTRAHRDEARPR
jgi:hypothetical protein